MIARLALTMLTALLLTGCATLNGSVPFKYVPSLATGQPIERVLGMERLTDARPEGDKSSTSDITDVAEKVTAKLLEDFRAAQLFERVDFPVRPGNGALIMRGQIVRFYWKYSTSPIMFIPIVSLASYFGAPVAYLEGIAALRVEITDATTGRTLGTYEKSSTREASSTIYNVKAGEFGAELADAFREVAKQLKDAIAADAQAGKLTAR
jgi:hypothetical protein